MVLKSAVKPQLISGSELQSLRAEWESLRERARCTAPFQSPRWLIPWCHIFAADDYAVVAMRRDCRLIALFPWIIARRSCEPVRRIAFLAAGVNDYRGALIQTRRKWRRGSARSHGS